MNELTAANWRTSTHSGPNGDCVQLAGLRDGVAVRDSKDPAGPVLRFSRREMASLIGQLRTSA
jgi:hypothetical protein